MQETMNSALLIAAIGMGLVFLSLILLWWLMELIVRLFKDKKNKETVVEVLPVENGSVLPGEDADTLSRKKRVAAAAVAYALAASQTSTTGSKEISTLSPWQVALRSRSFSSRSAAFGRKPQRNVK
jgi:Na+-transporting methylmalonyl-CoA/oxaloacetate decarboxylase gamma subunit